jgi:hypothetical protein
VLKVSAYMARPIIRAMKINENQRYVSKDEVYAYWRRRGLAAGQGVWNFFHLVKDPALDRVTKDSLEPFVRELVDLPHPGLIFLQNSVEFHDKYGELFYLKVHLFL